MTAVDEPVMWRSAREAHYDAVLVKPITASALNDTLVRVLDYAVDRKRLAPALKAVPEFAGA